MLMLNGHSRSSDGFTLVEVLVSIVIIVILASIAVVSYRGVTHRAEDARMLVTARSLESKVKIYAINSGSYGYPYTSSVDAGAVVNAYNMQDLDDYIVLPCETPYPSQAASCPDDGLDKKVIYVNPYGPYWQGNGFAYSYWLHSDGKWHNVWFDEDYGPYEREGYYDGQYPEIFGSY